MLSEHKNGLYNGIYSTYPEDKPSDKVMDFLRSNPNSSWKDRLCFMLDTYPQVSSENVNWALAGGAAIHLAHPERRTPDDIDVISFQGGLSAQFTHVGYLGLDVKGLDDWFRFHFFEQNKSTTEILFNHFTKLNFNGRQVIGFDDLLLAADKNSYLKGLAKRKKDKDDLVILNVKQEEINSLLSSLGFNNHNN
jgi:hypothetical protein